MFTKAVPLLRVVPRLQQTTRLGHGVPAHWKPMRQICEENKNHMNFMPVPAGSWQEHHAAQNAKWNKQLVAGLVLFIGTYTMLWQTGCIYYHSAPPMFNGPKQ
ncbi:hypothetical protein PoB_000155500 [Plakobranchus ocellatus]|uniref:Deltamethrin resistance protein prag01 domain-containing protein n=1 Tax=Plakobranchus ocellatus TaxID=259542 RepID=A0AAV3XW66_9GAST|nr:hypothetical protein PoB_000155500 [Plakobranchus ocellatus]